MTTEVAEDRPRMFGEGSEAVLTARLRASTGLIKRFSWARLVSNQRPLACEAARGPLVHAVRA